MLEVSGVPIISFKFKFIFKTVPLWFLQLSVCFTVGEKNVYIIAVEYNYGITTLYLCL